MIVCKVVKFDANRQIKNALIHFDDINCDFEVVKPDIKKIDAETQEIILDMHNWLVGKMQTGDLP
jgi:hypothetical protein